MQDYKKLDVWGKAHSLAIDIYHKTSLFPKEELYGITSQMRRATVSIPSNIAEGCGKESSAELKRYLQISLGSAHELEYLFILTKDLEILNNSDYDVLFNQVNEIKAMLIGLIQKISNS